jgi:hypothetical protein
MEGSDEFKRPPLEEPLSAHVRWKSDLKNKNNSAFVQKLTDQDMFTDGPKSVVAVIVTPSMLVQEVCDHIREAFRLHMFDG